MKGRIDRVIEKMKRKRKRDSDGEISDEDWSVDFVSSEEVEVEEEKKE